MDEEMGVFWNVARLTRLPLRFECENGLLLRGYGKVRIPFQTKKGTRPSCPDLEGKRGSD